MICFFFKLIVLIRALGIIKALEAQNAKVCGSTKKRSGATTSSRGARGGRGAQKTSKYTPIVRKTK